MIWNSDRRFLGEAFREYFFGLLLTRSSQFDPNKVGSRELLSSPERSFLFSIAVSHDGSEQSISMSFSSRTMGDRFPQADRQLGVQVDETTSTDCVPTRVAVSKATSFLCVRFNV
jgi:hypothetical protein